MNELQTNNRPFMTKKNYGLETIQIRSFIAIWSRSSKKRKDLRHSLENEFLFINDNEQNIMIAFAPRQKGRIKKTSFPKGGHVLILGDDSEYNTSLTPPGGSYTLIEYDNQKKNLKIITSIVGLPPVFEFSAPDFTIYSNDIYLISKIPFINLRFDQNGLFDFYSIGHPVHMRTLFEGVKMLRGGCLLEVDSEGERLFSKIWQMPERNPLKNWHEYNRLQIETFRNSIKSLNTANSFLSLTAGLDTRSILAALIKDGKRIPASTMSSKLLSLDAKTALNLCKFYGFEHKTIQLNDTFFKNLPDLAIKASVLSGGLSSLEQAHEVYFYTQTKDIGTRRISGNLGNQVCRLGVEKISMRNVDRSIFNKHVLRNNELEKNEWFTNTMGEIQQLSHEFLLQQEVPFTSVANYSIGSHFATQQVPYANKQLLENLSLIPDDDGTLKDLSPMQMRIRDLRHRFLGHSMSKSFQIQLINLTGGYVSSYPINWGWCANGGVSISGIFNGLLAFFDAAGSSKLSSISGADTILKLLRIKGFHEYTNPKQWIVTHLKDFVYDTLCSEKVKHCEIFKYDLLLEKLNEHYTFRKCNYKEILCALDIAITKDLYNVSI